MTSHEPPIQARGLGKRFRSNRVLEGLDFIPAAGQVTVLLGRNGAGKSTLMRLILGLVEADAGSLCVFGLDPIRHSAEVQRRIGFVPDTPDAYDWMTPEDWFRFLRPHFPGFDVARARSLCETLDVPSRTTFRDLSRGQAAKVMLIGAVAHDPELLLLDEPFAGLDPLARDEILGAVIGELRADHRTLLVTTHDLEIASRIADRIAFLADGRIVREVTSVELEQETSDATLPARLRRELALAEEVC